MAWKVLNIIALKGWVKLHYLDIESGFMVIFSVVSCSDGDLKLVGGSVVSTGRLQICFNKRWSTINADRWTEQYTEVACQQLGYLTEGYIIMSYLFTVNA